VLSITPAKEIKGTLALPSSPDLFFMSLSLAVVTGCRTRIETPRQTPQIRLWREWFSRRAAIAFDETSCTVQPAQGADLPCLRVSCADMPFSDFTVFLLLGHDKMIAVEAAPKRRLDQWRQCVERTGCALLTEVRDGIPYLCLEKTDHFRVPDVGVDSDDLHPFLGLAMGLRQSVECVVDQTWLSPLRQVLPCFGYDCAVRSMSQKKDEDPLLRRLRFLKTGKKSEGPQQFSISADFTKAPVEEVRLDLPGDEVMAALMIAAKCLVPKGSLVLENVGLETWNTQILQLLKSMGGVVGVQETRIGSFGSVGTVVVQKINPFGRKVDCRPRYQYASQLPAMVVMAAFAHGQSIFRNLQDWRNDDPDGIEQLNSCVAALGARYGEMPDGIVVEGAKQFDGFDIAEPLPAHVAGAFAVAGLKCRGATTINDARILERWPDFKNILDSVGDFYEPHS
jgi:hypothetical protein